MMNLNWNTPIVDADTGEIKMPLRIIVLILIFLVIDILLKLVLDSLKISFGVRPFGDEPI